MAMLSLTGFVNHLRDNFPTMAISYPTALKLVKAGSIRSIRVGGVYKISTDEAKRFASQGNYVEDPLHITPQSYAIPIRKVISDEADPTT